MRKIATVITSLGVFLFSVSPVWAENQTINIVQPSTIKITNLGKLIGSVIGVLLIVAAMAAFLYLLMGGLTWITSGGDKSKVESAQHRIQAALIGLIIVFAVWALFKVIGTWLGLPDIFSLELPSPAD